MIQTNQKKKHKIKKNKIKIKLQNKIITEEMMTIIIKKNNIMIMTNIKIIDMEEEHKGIYHFNYFIYINNFSTKFEMDKKI